MSRGDRRADILRAAERVIRSRRYHEIKLDEIAREAGVGKGTLYLYFKDKDDLFFQLVAEGFETLSDVMYQAIASGRPFREKFKETASALTRFMEQHRTMMRAVFEEERRRGGARPDQERGGRLGSHCARLHKAQILLMEQGVAEGVLRSDVPPLVLAHMLMGLLHSRQMMEVFEGLTVEADQITDVFLEGAGVRQGA